MDKAAVVGALDLLRAVDLFQLFRDLECAADVGLGPDEILVLCDEELKRTNPRNMRRDRLCWPNQRNPRVVCSQ